MVLEILADPGECVAHRDARLGQDLRIPDPGQLQQVRRADRAGGEDHPARRVGPLDRALLAAIAGELDTGRSGPVEEHPMHQRPGDDL